MKTYTVQEAALVCKCHAETIRIQVKSKSCCKFTLSNPSQLTN